MTVLTQVRLEVAPEQVTAIGEIKCTCGKVIGQEVEIVKSNHQRTRETYRLLLTNGIRIRYGAGECVCGLTWHYNQSERKLKQLLEKVTA